MVFLYSLSLFFSSRCSFQLSWHAAEKSHFSCSDLITHFILISFEGQDTPPCVYFQGNDHLCYICIHFVCVRCDAVTSDWGLQWSLWPRDIPTLVNVGRNLALASSASASMYVHISKVKKREQKITTTTTTLHLRRGRWGRSSQPLC